jgi:hypothetical protein
VQADEKNSVKSDVGLVVKKIAMDTKQGDPATIFQPLHVSLQNGALHPWFEETGKVTEELHVTVHAIYNSSRTSLP